MLLSHLYRDFLFSTITLDLPLYPALDVDVTATFDLATAWPVRRGAPSTLLDRQLPHLELSYLNTCTQTQLQSRW
jgi:hypothetical protein